jgi:hypothetical protein
MNKTITIKSGEAAINFKRFDPDNPPLEGHYLVMANDRKINFDYLSKYNCWGGSVMYGSSYEVIGYARIEFVYGNFPHPLIKLKNGSNQS